MNTVNSNEYFTPKSYIAFTVNKLRSGQLWKASVSIFEKIRKYTLISGIIRVFAFVISLLEKSALLLLVASAIFLIFPIAVSLALIYVSVCLFEHIRWNKKIRNWLVTGEPVTVFITDKKIFSKDENALFLRDAEQIASSHNGPVVIVCKDRFISAKWYSLNILAVKENYLFTIRRKFIEKSSPRSTYIVL